MDKKEILYELLNILMEYKKIKIGFGKNYERDRALFRGLCNQCLDLSGIDQEFYVLQDMLLSQEREEKGVVDIQTLNFENGIAHYYGDITTLKVDAIVNAANDQYLGCFFPCHDCIDNVIMSSAGFQMRNELFSLKKEKDYDKKKVKVTKGYNLPCKYVFHIAGPIVSYKVTEKQIGDLKNCYIYCMEQAKSLKLNSIAFCCISTGEYNFPNEIACDIAVDTVKKWLSKNNCDLKVIFDTFTEFDKELYDEKLQKKN